MSNVSRMKFVRIKDFYFLSVIMLIMITSWFSSPKLKEFVVSFIASAAYRFSRNKRRLGEKNLSETFNDKLSEDQRREIVKGAFYEFWKDTFSLSLSSVERGAIIEAEIRGVEHLHGALKNGMGVILWESVFFGRRTLAKQMLHENGFSIYQVHMKHHLGGFQNDRGSITWVQRHIIRPLFEKCEKQFVEEIIYLPNSNSLAFTRVLLNRLKQNSIICITGDVGFGQKLIPQRFLGRTKLFATGMVSLAKISGAPILPIFCIQERNGKASLIIDHPIQIETDVDRERGLENSIAQYAGLLESYIRRFPEKCRSWHYVDHFSTH